MIKEDLQKQIIAEVELNHAHPPMLSDSMILEVMDDYAEKIFEFAEWLVRKDEWHFIEDIHAWERDGYRRRTTSDLFDYYLKYKNIR